MEDYNRPIWQLTIGEFVEILDARKQESSENPTQEKVFNQEIYEKLWRLPEKRWNAIRNLLDLSWRRYRSRKISYQEIEAKGVKRERK